MMAPPAFKRKGAKKKDDGQQNHKPVYQNMTVEAFE